MKKLLLLSFTTLLLLGCTDKKNYEAAVLADLEFEQKTQSTRDYNVPADKMADCIVEASSQNMHGIFGLDPDRFRAYRNYTKMLTIKDSPDPKKTMEELRNDFGSAQELTEARSNYIESQLECLALFVEKSDEKVD